MENFCNFSQDKNYNYSNIVLDYYGYNGEVDVIYVVTCIIVCIGLPLTLVAIFALYSLVQNDQVAPIYVINLLISDLIQLCCMMVWVTHPEESNMCLIFFIYYFGLVASICFMVCVGLERYLIIAYPLWYRFRRTIKISVVVCVAVWALTLVYLITLTLWYISRIAKIISIIFFLLPFPLLTFFLGGTLNALSASISVSSDEKRRIIGMLVLVLLIYTLLFLPNVIWLMAKGAGYNNTFDKLSSTFLRLSPLADLVLYVFMRKGTIDKLLASVCCCRMDRNDVSSSTV